jgi:hypothetical protein
MLEAGCGMWDVRYGMWDVGVLEVGCWMWDVHVSGSLTLCASSSPRPGARTGGARPQRPPPQAEVGMRNRVREPDS